MYFFLQELKHLEFIKSQSPTVSLFFVKVPLQRNQISSAFSADSRLSNDSNSCEQTNSLPVNGTDVAALQDESNTLKVFQQIANIGFVCSISGLNERHPVQLEYDTDSDIGESELLDNFDNFWCLTQFVEGVLMRRLAAAVSSMITVHVTCLEMMIAVAYDMTRDVMFTPVFLKYAKDNEVNLSALYLFKFFGLSPQELCLVECLGRISCHNCLNILSFSSFFIGMYPINITFQHSYFNFILFIHSIVFLN